MHSEMVSNVCVEVLSIRGGRLLGSKSISLKCRPMAKQRKYYLRFCQQYYLSAKRDSSFPQRILISHALSEQQWIEAALSEQLHKKTPSSNPCVVADYGGWKWALANANQALLGHVAAQNHYFQWLEALQKALHLPNLPQRLECFDISHTLGEATVATCVRIWK